MLRRVPSSLTLAVLISCSWACTEPAARVRTSTHTRPLPAPRLAEAPSIIAAPEPEGPSVHAAQTDEPEPEPQVSGNSAEIDELVVEGLDALIGRAIARGELPGAVVAVGDHAGIRSLRAFGSRTEGETMTVDTVFDLASVTKPVATASALMKLVEEGRVRLDDRASLYLPELATPDKRSITLRMLLLHTSGLPSVNPLAHYEQGRDDALSQIGRTKLLHTPGSAYQYSDLGFIVLGEVVARAAGMGLDQVVSERILAPLSMHDSSFGVRDARLTRTAPTEERDGRVIRGEVDDPRAYRLGGAAGNAGLFSTASDLSRFARMLLNRGSLDGQRVFEAHTVDMWLKPVAIHDTTRTLGFDVQSNHAHGKGTLMSSRAVGHGGYTGTQLWIDPERDLFVILLTNRVHAGPQGTIHPLSGSITDLCVATVDHERESLPRVLVGIDVLEAEAFARVRGKRLALLTHQAARNRRGVTTLDRLLAAPQVHVRAVLAPEHGLSSNREGHVGHARYGERQIPVFSLFGKTRRPAPHMLSGVELVVIDLVDVGTRFYTYMSTALATLEAAAELNIPVMLLDRPNPIGADTVEGPVSEPDFESFVNYHPLPLRHGMTPGELLGFLSRERGLGTPLEVVRMLGYRRDARFPELGLTWYPPSPNLLRYEQALLYPGTAIVEGTNVSVGRGTARAFEVIGAPFIDGEALAREISAFPLEGVRVAATHFTPRIGPYAGQRVAGVSFEVSTPERFSAVKLGLAVARALHRLYPDTWESSRLAKMVAHGETAAAVLSDVAPDQLFALWQAELSEFESARAQVLLY